jgi:(p)ppGpp synthase/HD superfamily hydrolase
MDNDISKKSVYIPKHSYINGTSDMLKNYFKSKSINVVEGNDPNALKQKLWNTADIIIPPTHITEETFLERANEIIPGSIELTPFSDQKIKQAIDLAKQKHFGQLRQNKNDYFTGHILPCTLYLILVQTRTKDCLSQDMIIAMLCHDLVEDTDVTLDDLETMFGTTVRHYVELLTKKSKNHYKEPENYDSVKDYENFINLPKADRKKLRNEEYVAKVLTGEYEVLVMKCVDRLLNLMDDIQNLVRTQEVERVRAYAKESQDHYKIIFERVADRNPFYLMMFGVLEDIIRSA